MRRPSSAPARASSINRRQADNPSTQYGYSLTTNYTASNDGGQTPSGGSNFAGPYLLGNPFPNGIANPLGNGLGLLTNVGNSIAFNNPQYRTPRTYQYSIGFQRQLPWGVNAEVSYAGNKEIFVPVSYNQSNSPANAAQSQAAIADPNLLSHSIPNPFYGILPVSSSLGASATTTYGNLLRNYPLFTQLQQGYICGLPLPLRPATG